MKRTTIWTAAAAMMLLTVFAAAVMPARADERADLKERFKQRYATLLKLKDEGKVGETAAGLVDVVKPQYSEGKVGSQTVGQFIQDENMDRTRLYVLLADEATTSPAVVARRNAERNFERASPEHYLKPRDGKWVQKKNYHP
ncbi:MAG: DUF1318 domain-containing protein [Phycisphaeraceae bacterium]